MITPPAAVIHPVDRHEAILQPGGGFDLHTFPGRVSIFYLDDIRVEGQVELYAVQILHIFDDDGNRALRVGPQPQR